MSIGGFFSSTMSHLYDPKLGMINKMGTMNGTSNTVAPPVETLSPLITTLAPTIINATVLNLSTAAAPIVINATTVALNNPPPVVTKV